MKKVAVCIFAVLAVFCTLGILFCTEARADDLPQIEFVDSLELKDGDVLNKLYIVRKGGSFSIAQKATIMVDGGGVIVQGFMGDSKLEIVQVSFVGYKSRKFYGIHIVTNQEVNLSKCEFADLVLMALPDLYRTTCTEKPEDLHYLIKGDKEKYRFPSSYVSMFTAPILMGKEIRCRRISFHQYEKAPTWFSIFRGRKMEFHELSVERVNIKHSGKAVGSVFCGISPNILPPKKAEKKEETQSETAMRLAIQEFYPERVVNWESTVTLVQCNVFSCTFGMMSFNTHTIAYYSTFEDIEFQICLDHNCCYIEDKISRVFRADEERRSYFDGPAVFRGYVILKGVEVNAYSEYEDNATEQKESAAPVVLGNVYGYIMDCDITTDNEMYVRARSKQEKTKSIMWKYERSWDYIEKANEEPKEKKSREEEIKEVTGEQEVFKTSVSGNEFTSLSPGKNCEHIAMLSILSSDEKQEIDVSCNSFRVRGWGSVKSCSIEFITALDCSCSFTRNKLTITEEVELKIVSKPRYYDGFPASPYKPLLKMSDNIFEASTSTFEKILDVAGNTFWASKVVLKQCRSFTENELVHCSTVSFNEMGMEEAKKYIKDNLYASSSFYYYLEGYRKMTETEEAEAIGKIKARESVHLRRFRFH